VLDNLRGGMRLATYFRYGGRTESLYFFPIRPFQPSRTQTYETIDRPVALHLKSGSFMCGKGIGLSAEVFVRAFRIVINRQAVHPFQWGSCSSARTRMRTEISACAD
jgi:hypothetical protein